MFVSQCEFRFPFDKPVHLSGLGVELSSFGHDVFLPGKALIKAGPKTLNSFNWNRLQVTGGQIWLYCL